MCEPQTNLTLTQQELQSCDLSLGIDALTLPALAKPTVHLGQGPLYGEGKEEGHCSVAERGLREEWVVETCFPECSASNPGRTADCGLCLEEPTHKMLHVNRCQWVLNLISCLQIREHEFYHGGSKLKFNALLTTYEILLKDKVSCLCVLPVYLPPAAPSIPFCSHTAPAHTEWEGRHRLFSMFCLNFSRNPQG